MRNVTACRNIEIRYFRGARTRFGMSKIVLRKIHGSVIADLSRRRLFGFSPDSIIEYEFSSPTSIFDGLISKSYICSPSHGENPPKITGVYDVTFGMEIVQSRQDELDDVLENIRWKPSARHPSLKKPDGLPHGFKDKA
jgi:hypothetical protein